MHNKYKCYTDTKEGSREDYTSCSKCTSLEYLAGLMLQEFSHSHNCVCWPVLTLNERERVLLFNNEYISEHDA